MPEQQQSEQKQKWYLALLCLQVIEADTPNQKAFPWNVNGKTGTMKPIMQETDLC